MRAVSKLLDDASKSLDFVDRGDVLADSKLAKLEDYRDYRLMINLRDKKGG
jgi:hypothetical protein